MNSVCDQSDDSFVPFFEGISPNFDEILRMHEYSPGKVLENELPERQITDLEEVKIGTN